MNPATQGQSRRTAFLLSQLGAVASSRFADRTRQIGLTPGDAGVIRLLGRAPGLSQRSVAEKLGIVPSRVVPLIDSLQGRGLVDRTRSSTDRRNYELHLTGAGQQVLHELRGIAEQHEAELLAPLTGDQASQLGVLLAQLADAHGLDRDLHRGSVSQAG